MVQIVGKYQYTSAENFEEFIKSLGKPEIVETFLTSTPLVEIQQNGEQWVVIVNTKGKTITSTFKLGEVYEEHLPTPGTVFKSVTTRQGDTFTTETPLTADVKVYRAYEFHDDGMTVHVSSTKNDIKAKRIYKRL